MLKYNIIVFFFFLIVINIYGQDSQIEVGIDEKLGNILPGEAQFVTSEGDTVLLKNVIKKPTLLALIYYECPGICNPLLTELAWVINKVDLVPLEDFQVISLSFDHEETVEIAKRWKQNYFAGMKNPFPDSAWLFLVGDSINIKTITDAVGFYYIENEEEYLHPGAVVAISPERMISRYLFGITFNQFDVKMALLDADAGKTNPTISKVLQFCFSYDPEGRNYTLNVTRIMGSIILLSVGIFLSILIFKKKKNSEGV